VKNFLTQVKIEFILHLREAEAIFWGFVFPVIMIVALGFIFSSKDETELLKTKIAFVGSADGKIIMSMKESKQFIIEKVDKDSITELLKIGKYPAVIEEFVSDSLSEISVYYPSIAGTEFLQIKSDLQNFLTELNKQKLSARNIEFPYNMRYKEVEIKSEKGDKISYIAWLIPGVLGLNLFLSCIFGIGISIVMDKKNGKLKKIATTPLSKSQFIAVIATQRLSVLLLQAFFIALAGYFIFDIAIQGSILDLLLLLILSNLSFMVFGFAVAAVSKTIEKAVAISNLFFILSMVVSGAYFTNEGLPAWLKIFTDQLPATLCIDVLRGIYSYGQSILDFQGQILGLLVWIVVSMLLSIKLFKWVNE
jgi:ABC-2 type transport system permease protein